jgi:hypothetical protein
MPSELCPKFPVSLHHFDSVMLFFYAFAIAGSVRKLRLPFYAFSIYTEISRNATPVYNESHIPNQTNRFLLIIGYSRLGEHGAGCNTG